LFLKKECHQEEGQRLRTAGHTNIQKISSKEDGEHGKREKNNMTRNAAFLSKTTSYWPLCSFFEELEVFRFLLQKIEGARLLSHVPLSCFVIEAVHLNKSEISLLERFSDCDH